MANQNPEQKARDHIDEQLIACGWLIQGKNKINLAAGLLQRLIKNKYGRMY